MIVVAVVTFVPLMVNAKLHALVWVAVVVHLVEILELAFQELKVVEVLQLDKVCLDCFAKRKIRKKLKHFFRILC